MMHLISRRWPAVAKFSGAICFCPGVRYTENSMIAIGQVLNKILGASDNWKFQLVTRWTTIIGPLATRMHIEKIERDIIVISVCDAAWLQELYLLSDVLLRKINQALPAPYLKKIIFKHAHIPQEKLHSQAKPKIVCQKAPAPARPLSLQEREALAGVHDQELSAALQQFLIRCQQTNTH